MTELEKNGFVILKNVFEPEELGPVTQLTEEIIEFSNKYSEDFFHKYYLPHRTDQGTLSDLFQRHPEFQNLAKNTRVLEALTPVLGPNIFLYENSLVYKPKGKRNGVPWHQDFINRPKEPIKYIVWIALDKVTIENGALKVIPGSHKNGFLPWYRVKGETHHDRLKLDGLDLSTSLHVEMEIGDVLIFNQLLVHGSDETHTDIPRRAFRVSYQGFPEVFVPRGAPILLHGGKPKDLAPYLESLKALPKPNSIQKLLHKIGNRLLRF